MMSLFQAFVLALLQGVTELLPISSSGYMIIAAWALGWSVPSAGFDASVHLGSTLALVLFFRRDWMLILKAARCGRTIPLGGDDDAMSLQMLERRRRIGDTRRRLSIVMSMSARSLLGLVVIGSLPALAFGAALYGVVTSESVRSPQVVGGMFIVTAGILLMGHYSATQRLSGKDKRERSKVLTVIDALVIGMGQALALLPGISRSATTVSVGLSRGLPAVVAIRFSYLLATPVIVGAMGLSVLSAVFRSDEAFPGWGAVGIGVVTSFVSSYLAVWVFMWIVRRLGSMSLVPFALFVAATGAVTLSAVYLN